MEPNCNETVTKFNNSNNEIDVVNNRSVDHNLSVRNDSVTQLDPRFDLFHCGKCGANFGSIDRFVFHKLSEESFGISYERVYINGNAVKLPKLYQKDITNDSNNSNDNNNKCDQRLSQSVIKSNDSNNEMLNEVKATEINENESELETNGQTVEQEVQVEKEVSKTNPIVTIIIEGQNNKKFYNCNDCKKTFTQKCRAVRHLESVHNWDRDSLTRVNKSINTHNNNNDGNSYSESSIPQSMKRVKCDKCGANIKGKRALKVHQLTHSEERNFSCPYDGCSFMFKTKGSMQRHCRRHTNERPFKCDLCGRNFRESGALTRHLKSRYVCSNKSDSDLPNYGKARALPSIDSKFINK